MAARGTNAYAPMMLAALRIMTALLYIEHGAIKLFGFPPGAAPGKVPLMGLFGVAGVLEFIGGGLILLGLLTRPVAFLLAGQMAVAYFMAHAPSSPFPAINHGEPAILFCFIFLYLAVAGPGALSVDGGRRR
ncbi:MULTISPECIES: DoxX family protein [Sphingosinicellaceae]|uniref:DoxX family protein n=1 Tax=Sphingosinicellaceae TaxID=2820280 RepID=UPI001C1E41F0|nr:MULTISPECIES: DoxX family protein [Polymorphobacter]QYE34695.1 DoxX family protein [Polymorphobacter sp. PAMC 29334]UAJ09902.1 DoxX family protein [Polymorphobacter megasporae]